MECLLLSKFAIRPQRNFRGKVRSHHCFVQFLKTILAGYLFGKEDLAMQDKADFGLPFLSKGKLAVICFRRETEIILTLIFFVSPSFPHYAKGHLFSCLP